MILKLHQLPGKANLSWDEQHGIRVLYFNETLSPIESEPYVLRIPICLEADFCTVKKFFSFVSDYVLTNAQWSTMCYQTSPISNGSPTTNRVLLALIVVFALALLVALFVISSWQSKMRMRIRFYLF